MNFIWTRDQREVHRVGGAHFGTSELICLLTIIINGFPFPLPLSNFNQQEDFDDDRKKRYVSCPVCGRILMKCQGQCNIEITCGKCNKEIVAIVDEERVMVLEDRRGNSRTGQVKVSVAKTKGCKQMQPMKRAANY